MIRSAFLLSVSVTLLPLFGDAQTLVTEDTSSSAITTLPEATVIASSEEELPMDSYLPIRATTATRTSADPLVTPVSIGVVPEQLITDQAPRRIQDLYQNVSGVVPAYTANNPFDVITPTIRGFETFSTYRDGFFVGGTANPPIDTIERLEIIKGPNAVLFGLNEPGGVLNIITKQPQVVPSHSLEQSFGSFDYYKTTLDSTGPVPGTSETLFFRVIGSYVNEGSFRDFVEGEQFVFAPSLLWQPNPDFTLSASFSYNYDQYVFDNGIVYSPRRFVVPFAPVVDDSTFLQEPGYLTTSEESIANLSAEYQVTEDWKVRGLFHFHYNRIDLNAFRFFGDPVVNPAGQIILPIRYDGTVPTIGQFQWIVDSTYKFELGPTRHELLAGVDVLWEPKELNTQDGPRSLRPIPMNVLAPTYGALPGPFSLTSFFGDRQWVGLYLQDQIKMLDDRLHVLLGGRIDNVWQRVNFQDPSSAFSFAGSQFDADATFRGGILYELFPWSHPYFSYSQGFNPTSPFTEGNLDPERSEQFELGVKAPLLDGKVVATLAFYHLEKQNVAVDFDGDGLFSNGGNFRSRGIEFDLTGEILPGLNAIFTYAYTDTEVLKSDFIPVGSRFRGVPEHSGGLTLSYSFSEETALDGLTLGTSLYVSGDRPGDDSNNFEVSGYQRWGAFARYEFEVGQATITSQLNFDNLLDQSYVESVGGVGSIFPGAPFNVTGSIGVRF